MNVRGVFLIYFHHPSVEKLAKMYKASDARSSCKQLGSDYASLQYTRHTFVANVIWLAVK
jgi:hypothetical protein